MPVQAAEKKHCAVGGGGKPSAQISEDFVVFAQLVGTKLKINIEEGQPEREKNEDSKTEIKAPYSGTVLKIMTRSGTAAVRQEEYR